MVTEQNPSREYKANRRREHKARAIGYLGGACRHCGTTYPGALLFIHHPHTVAAFQISQGLEQGWGKIQPELNKCYLACRTCHANGGVPKPYAPHPGQYTVTPMKRQLSPQEERKALAEAKRLDDGADIYAGDAVREHNAMAARGRGRECVCDFCEDTRQGRELPPAYQLRLKDLKNWGN